MSLNRKLWMWIIWILVSGFLASYYAFALVGEDKSAYLPGNTTSGHYQIELVCKACHTDGFGGIDALQKACVNCHGKELKAVDDSHPKSKFTDPRNADRVAILDARYCVTCHKEHVPDRTHEMGVTLPDDFCAYCHQDIEEDRKSHKDMAFDTCASAGCHNFHDNKALYEDFLVKYGRVHESVLEKPVVIERNFSAFYKAVLKQEKNLSPLGVEQAVFPSSISVDKKIINDWASTSHARQSVNCNDCHTSKVSADNSDGWITSPTPENCKSCHQIEVDTYLQGKHGMRLAQELSRMNTGMARQKLKSKIKDKDLDCNSCHGAHDFNTAKAAVDACLQCHEDEHTKAFDKSQHYKLWQQAQLGRIPKEQGVSCATCHLPRIEIKQKGKQRVLVNHNQNHNLRPNEKMIRDTCMSCHSLRFAIDALADPQLVGNNFNGKPAINIASIDMAIKREKIKAREKKNSNKKD